MEIRWTQVSKIYEDFIQNRSIITRAGKQDGGMQCLVLYKSVYKLFCTVADIVVVTRCQEAKALIGVGMAPVTFVV